MYFYPFIKPMKQKMKSRRKQYLFDCNSGCTQNNSHFLHLIKWHVKAFLFLPQSYSQMFFYLNLVTKLDSCLFSRCIVFTLQFAYLIGFFFFSISFFTQNDTSKLIENFMFETIFFNLLRSNN